MVRTPNIFKITPTLINVNVVMSINQWSSISYVNSQRLMHLIYPAHKRYRLKEPSQRKEAVQLEVG